MTKKRGLLLDGLNSAAAFMMFASLAALPAGLLLNRPYVISLFVIPYALCFWLRRKLKHLSLFLLLHIAMPFAMLLPAAGLYQRLMYIALMLIIVIHSAVKRFKNTPPDISAAFVSAQAIFAGALAIAAGYLNQPAAAFIQPVTVGIVFICFIVFQHIKNLDETLDLITRTTTQPVHAIFSANNRIIAVFAAIAGIAALLSAYIKLDKAVSTLGNGLLAILRFLLGLLNAKKEAAPEAALPETPQQPAMPFPFAPDDAKPWPIWEILGNILYYAVIAALILGAAGLAIYLCIRIYRRFYETVKTDDEIEVIPHDSLAAEAVKAIRAFFMPVSGIRRHFYRKIKRYIGKGVPIRPSDTPEEMTAKISEEDISRLTEAYQKARY